VPDAVVAVYPDLFETFVATKPHVLLRFGRWEEILAEPIPQDATLYAATRVLMFYARAVALANLGRDAGAAVAGFEEAFSQIPDTRYLFQNKAVDVLAVAGEMMRGEVAFKSGDRAAGLAHLRTAVRLDDGLHYEEPWAWPQPSRHALGALLMEDGQFDEAEAVYRADLGMDPEIPRALQNPGNIWALAGLDECLARRGERVERAYVARALAQAQARAEVPVRASCYCRRSVA
jgi:tetratricopeptide (TPR) repeat protein